MHVSGSWFFASLATALGGAAAFALTPSDWWSWMLPVVLSAPLILVDVVRWGRGIYDTFDPAALVGLLGTYHFIVAPFVHASTGYWATFLPDVDWVGSLTTLAWLNLIGLVLYRVAFFIARSKRTHADGPRSLPSAVGSGAALGLGLAVLVQGAIVFQFGGVSGYIHAISARGEGTLDGLGPVFAIGEAAPFFVAILYVVKRHGRRVPMGELAAFFTLMAAMSLAFGGARGSRNTFLWPLLIAAFLVHRYIRRIPRRAVAAGLLAAVAFSYVYAFYKVGGTDAIQALGQGASLTQLEEQTGRPPEVLLVDDLARIGIHAWVLGRLNSDHVPFEPAMGETYLGALSLPIPDRVVSLPFRTKSEVGTDLRFGPGAAERGQTSSRIYGAGGEAMLNLGPWALPLAYLALGVAVQWLRRKAVTGGVVAAPLAVIAAMYALLNDSDNLVFFAVKVGAFPAATIWLATRIGRHRCGGWSATPSEGSTARAAPATTLLPTDQTLDSGVSNALRASRPD